MTQSEAKIELAKGNKLTHTYFTPKEYICTRYGIVYDDNDHVHRDFWELRESSDWKNGWEIFKTIK